MEHIALALERADDVDSTLEETVGKMGTSSVEVGASVEPWLLGG